MGGKSELAEGVKKRVWRYFSDFRGVGQGASMGAEDRGRHTSVVDRAMYTARGWGAGGNARGLRTSGAKLAVNALCIFDMRHIFGACA